MAEHPGDRWLRDQDARTPGRGDMNDRNRQVLDESIEQAREYRAEQERQREQRREREREARRNKGRRR